MNTHAASWDRAIAGTESRSIVRGPHPPKVDAPAAHTNDPIDRLPEMARRKFQALDDRRADLRTLALEAHDRRNDLTTEKTKVAHRLATLIDPAVSMRDGNGFVCSPDHPSVVDAQAKLDKATAEYERISEKCDELASRAQPIGSLHSACERYLKQTHGQTLVAFNGMAPKTRRNETPAKAIERIRTERVKLEADLHATQSAPITSAEAKDAIRQEITDLAQRGVPDCLSLLARGASGVGWPKTWDSIDVEGATPVYIPTETPEGKTTFKTSFPKGLAQYQHIDTLALTTWLFRDQLLERLEGEIDSIADDANALDKAERNKRERSSLAAILDSERAEEWFCEQVEAEGGTIERRPDCDPRAFLGVQGPALANW